MKYYITSLFLVLCVFAFGQKLKTRNAMVSFDASMPAVEKVAAKNSNSSAVLDTKTGKFAVLSLIKGFKFKIALMQEHFNENYVDSEKYPKATFSGTIHNFDYSKLNSKAKTYTIKGKLSMNGHTKDITDKTTILKKNGKIMIQGDFNVTTNDFKINVPKVVAKKVSSNVKVLYNIQL